MGKKKGKNNHNNANKPNKSSKPPVKAIQLTPITIPNRKYVVKLKNGESFKVKEVIGRMYIQKIAAKNYKGNIVSVTEL